LSCTIDESHRLVVSGGSLRVLAAVARYVGGMVLLLKGGSLPVEAGALKPEEAWPRLSRPAHGDYPLLIDVATLDLSIAVILLGSSHIFWKQKVTVE